MITYEELSGKLYRVYNVTCDFLFTTNLSSKITTNISLNCLIPQERFVE